MARKSTDKSPEEIRFMLHRRGWTFSDVDHAYGLKVGIAGRAARYPHLHGELAIAEVLETSPRQLWPKRYDPQSGTRFKPQPSANYKPRPGIRHCQKVRAA